MIRSRPALPQLCLSRDLEIEPGAAALLMHLYESKSPQTSAMIAAGTQSAQGSTRVRIQHVRAVLGPGSVPISGSRGDIAYRLSPAARQEVSEILDEMAQEVSQYLKHLATKAAA